MTRGEPRVHRRWAPAARARRAYGAVAALGALVTLSACSPAPELDPGAATELQAAVLAVTQAAAAGRLDEAETGVSQVRETLEAAVDSGAVSAERYGEIDDALDRTAAELGAARQAEAERLAAEQAAAEQAAAAQAEADRLAAEQAAADQAAAERAAQDQATGREQGDEDDKPGPGRGRGNQDD